jgi:DNA-binding transcriptional LysR family regulator
MTLEQLRIFVAVAERQHVTQAASALNLAQSAASHAIAALEARHGAKLFNRVGRRIELTEAGRFFLGEARAILAQVSRAELALGEFATLERGSLTIHASQTIASYWLPRHLVAFQRTHPKIAISLVVGNTTRVAEAVETGVADLGFVEGAVDNDDLESRAVARDQLVLVVGPGHVWAKRTELTPADLLGGEWILREPGSGTRSVFEKELARLGLASHRLKVILELPSNEAVRAAVEAGGGATAISASVAAPSLEAELLRLVSFRLPEREFRVLQHRQRYGSRIAEAFMASIEGIDGRKSS